MAKAEIVLKGLLPGAAALRGALAAIPDSDFVLTAFDDGVLKIASEFIGEDSDRTVLPFAEVVSRLCGCAEIPTRRLPTQGQIRAAIGLACGELASSSVFSDSASFRGTHLEIERSLELLRHYGVDPGKLAETGSDRLADLALISTSVEGHLDRIGREFLSSQVQKLLLSNAIHRIPFPHIVFAAGSNPPPAYLLLARWLQDHGVRVTVLATVIPESSNLDRHANRFTELLGSPLNAPELIPWYSALFSDLPLPEGGPHLEISNSSDRLSECEWALRAALDAAHGGVSAHRIGVFVRDLEGYAPLLRACSDRLGVPLSTVIKTPLLTNGFALLVLNLIQALAGNDTFGLMALTGNSLWKMTWQDRTALESKLLDLRGAGTSSWETLLEWSTEQAEPLDWLTSALKWRTRARIEPQSLTKWHGLVRELIEETGLAQRIGEHESITRERDQRASFAMLRSLADFASVCEALEPKPAEIGSFARLCRSLWEDEDTVLPHTRNGVQVVSNPEAIPELERLHVLGMLEGTMPKRRRENPIIRDSDVNLINQHFSLQSPLPTSFEIAAREREVFLSICGSASKSISFSYPRTDEESDNVPAFYLAEIRRKAASSLVDSTYAASEFTPAAENCRAPADLDLQLVLDRPPAKSIPPRLTSDGAKNRMRPEFAAGIQVGELARSLTCPFQSGFRYRLSLYRDSESDPISQLARIPVRARLQLAQTPELATAALQAEVDALISRSKRDHEEWQTALIESASQRLVAEWVRREFTAREVWPREPGTERYEVALKDGLKNEIQVGPEKIVFNEQVASVGVTEGFSVVKIYASSAPDKKVFESDEPSSDLLRYGLLMLAQHGSRAGVGIEVDGMSGSRKLFLAGKGDYSGLRSSAGESVERFNVSEDLMPLWKRIKSSLKAAVDVLETANLAPKPGDHCSRCQYGDLCRVSTEFNHTVKDFESEESSE